MGEPWLDSLSEDWKSEHHSSSPAASISSRQQSGQTSFNKSQSRIPHLAQNMRKDSSGPFLKHRSARSLSRSKTEPVLTERSASSLNVPAPANGSLKRMSGSTLPRRTSNAFSDSQNSVQHYSLRGSVSKIDTPEWKRKLAQGDDMASDGVDLFSPSKLQGMFREPASKPERENESSLLEGLSKPWDSYKLPSAPSISDQYQSLRASRSRPPGMDVLQEVDEDEAEHMLSAISSDVVRQGSIRGIVHKRVQSLERLKTDVDHSSPPPTRPNTASGLESADDPRWRTFSGRQEIGNEFISPITASRQNTIRDNVLKDSTHVDIEALDRKLAQIGVQELRRPSSSSSDRDVSYNAFHEPAAIASPDPNMGDITSQSLPDDLSMGTQDFISHGGYVNHRRGAPSGDVSLLKPRQCSVTYSQVPARPLESLPSSPPSFQHIQEGSMNDIGQDLSHSRVVQDTTSHQLPDASILHHSEPKLVSKSSASPLKLFGNRDTYTNNKLMRILSQFDDSDQPIEQVATKESLLQDQSQSVLRVSHFGQGDLDDFNFEFQKQVSLSPQERKQLELDGSPIFKHQHVLPEVASGLPAKSQPQESWKANSPTRTPKRRRTLRRDEIHVEHKQLEVRVDQSQDRSLLAGTKRKDARPGDAGVQAEAEVLASRTLLNPTISRRSSSVSKIPQLSQTPETRQSPVEVTEALAAELATFAQEIVQVQNDSRKPSLATKDYMEEANKVMQFIRSRGKPQTVLPQVSEPDEQSELDPDKILDLDIDDGSTKDEFSRPPSRDGPRRSSVDRRHAVHDPETANHLRKYQEDDDLELLANTSGLGTFRVVDNQAAQEASQIPVPDDSDPDKQESSPPNMRILNPARSLRKRKYSASTVGEQAKMQSTGSSGDSSQRTFPTNSSSGHKGMITSGTVSIPDQIGKMTYDHHQQRWIPVVKQQHHRKSVTRSERTTNSEADPFENIPDLSFDERAEEEAKLGSRPSTMDSKMRREAIEESFSHMKSKVSTRPPHPPSSTQNAGLDVGDHGGSKDSSLRSEASQHEARLHNGLASQPPKLTSDMKKQARVVTIAFSSPLVSAVQYPDELSDIDDDVDLPLDDSELSCTPEAEPKKSFRPKSSKRDQKYENYRAMTLSRRPVSRIDEHDEDQPNAERSLIHMDQAQEMTPVQKPQNRQLTKRQQTTVRNSSILCLTPLSDFTIDQIDRKKHPEESFVEERLNPKALRQAHGSLALQVDSLVKAITDEEPSEIYWEHIRKITLERKGLTSLHGLLDYCSGLEQLSVAKNKITHLNGLPPSLRVLNICHNALSSLASWGQLSNLQYLDVSSNALDNVDGLNSLVHLRKLVANDNVISNLDGILELDGLLELQVRGNALTDIDFASGCLDRLRKVDLSANRLSSVRNLHQLVSLEEIKLSNNRLMVMPIEETTTSVRSINISSNQISHVDLTLLPNIESLRADGNNIQQIVGLAGAYGMQTLSLRSQIGTSNLVTNVLTTPNECRSIFLSSNAVPGGVFGLPQLPQCNVRELELAGCGISELPVGFGDFFPNCRRLSLDYNAVKDIACVQGMVKLSRLSFVRNRVKRMRRTCLVLARLQTLLELDMRDNPLTLGFYPPAALVQEANRSEGDRFALSNRDVQEDAQWVARLDETTQLKRRAVELLLGQGCTNLIRLDGIAFLQGRLEERPLDATWDRLTQKGVLAKPTSTTVAPELKFEGEEADEEGNELPMDMDEGIDMSAMIEERSLMID